MILAALFSVLCVAGHQQPAAEAAEPPSEAEAAPAGLWPTERIVELTVRRWAMQAAQEYELTDEQHRQVEARMLERWPKFLQENRRELQPLVNEFFEARLGLDPPSREQVQDWASRALPVLEKIQEQIEDGIEDIGPLLSAPQRAKFEAKVGQVRTDWEGYRQPAGMVGSSARRQ
jgi:hypothetical protein